MSDELFATKRALLDLITQLYCVLHLDREKQDLCTIETFLSSLCPIDMMDYLVQHLLPHKTAIETKNKTFFIHNHVLFGPLEDPSAVDYYSNVFSDKSRVTEEDEECIFEHFMSILDFVVAHKKLK